MHLSSLSLQGFRSYSQLNLNLEGNVHLFIGPNGSGKTNIVEALSLLSTGRSCLGAKTEEVVRWGAPFFRLRSELAMDAGDTVSLEVVHQWQPSIARAHYFNDVRCSLATFIGTLPTVTFLPQALDIFTGSPDTRRRFLDALLVQLESSYLMPRMEYDRIRKQRNALLKRIDEGHAQPSELAPWTVKLAELGGLLRGKRIEAAINLSQKLTRKLQELGENFGIVDFQYRFGDETFLSVNVDALRQSLAHDLRETEKRDIAAGITTRGPHRDDWIVRCDSRDIATFASRGQQRTALLALLLISVELLKAKRNEAPLILLDDVFSELDDEHQKQLLEGVGESQVMMTATHVPKGLPKDVVLWLVDEGTVKRNQGNQRFQRNYGSLVSLESLDSLKR